HDQELWVHFSPSLLAFPISPILFKHPPDLLTGYIYLTGSYLEKAGDYFTWAAIFDCQFSR
ncbi:unnamed protein product, partial [Musa textilis]